MNSTWGVDVDTSRFTQKYSYLNLYTNLGYRMSERGLSVDVQCFELICCEDPMVWTVSLHVAPCSSQANVYQVVVHVTSKQRLDTHQPADTNMHNSFTLLYARQQQGSYVCKQLQSSMPTPTPQKLL